MQNMRAREFIWREGVIFSGIYKGLKKQIKDIHLPHTTKVALTALYEALEAFVAGSRFFAIEILYVLR